MHGGIGRSINFVRQIEDLQRPITMEAGSVVLMDLLWYSLNLYMVLVHNVICAEYFVVGLIYFSIYYIFKF